MKKTRALLKSNGLIASDEGRFLRVKICAFMKHSSAQ
jgi:hypothetical protein